MDSIVAFDAARLWSGGTARPFLIEIGFRGLPASLNCVVLIRLLGGRAVAQMAMTDLALAIALGSAVDDLTFHADVPVPHAPAVITVVILATKGGPDGTGPGARHRFICAPISTTRPAGMRK